MAQMPLTGGPSITTGSQLSPPSRVRYSGVVSETFGK